MSAINDRETQCLPMPRGRYNSSVASPPPPRGGPTKKPALAGNPTRRESYRPEASDSVPKMLARPGIALGKVDAFVLSKVDGKRSVSDLATLVGLSPREVASILKRLVDLGAIELHKDALLAVDAGWDDAPLSGPTGPGIFEQTTAPGVDPREPGEE
jgi:hypothetical protein